MANSDRKCSVPECNRPHLAKGFCGPHYTRNKRYGDPLAGGTLYGAPREYLLETVVPYDGDECLHWPFAENGVGYGVIMWDGRMKVVNRVVCELVHGPAPTPKHEVAHSCGKGHEGCCAPKHLRWATRRENHADKLGHGTLNRGTLNGSAKLTADDVLAIRASRGIVRQVDLAERYGVTFQTVSDIQRRRIWSWL